MRDLRRSVARSALAVGVLVVGVGCSSPPRGAAAAPNRASERLSTASLSAAPQAGIEVLGTGSGMIEGFAVAWGNALQNSAGGGSLVTYSETGSTFGRDQWAKGNADFAIAGRPLIDQDRQALGARGTGAIEAPIAVSAMTFLMSGPAPSPLRLLVPGATADDPFVAQKDWTDPVQMPNELLARIFLERSVPLGNEPSFVAQIPALQQLQPQQSTDPAPADFQLQTSVRPVTPVVRSDPGAVDYYLNKFVEVSAPAALQAKATAESVDLARATEAWRFISTPSRSGDGQIAGLVSSWLIPTGSSKSVGGTVGPVSQSAVLRERLAQALVAEEDRTPLYVLEIQNGAGNSVAPTTATITKGAELTQDSPLAQLTDPGASSDAYPLTWLSSIFVQSSGLSIGKTSVIATLIRYGVTAGQDAADLLNEGRLPAAQVAKALAAADAVVDGNCVGSDRKIIIDSTGGPYWPTGVAPPKDGARVCVSIAAAGVAAQPIPPVSGQEPTAAPGSSPLPGASPPATRSGSASVGRSSGRSTSGATSSFTENLFEPVPSTETAEASSGVSNPGKGVAALAAAALPMQPPDDGRKSLDRLSTMLLGGVALLVARAVLRRSRASE